MLTLDDIKSYLGITGTAEDARLTLIRDAVNQYIEDVTLTNWSTTAKTRSEILDLRDNVMLGRMGILSITEVREYQRGTETQSAPLAADTYTYSDVGRLTIDQNYGDDYNRSHYNALHVTYTYGLPVGGIVPADLKLAALQMAREYYEGTDGNDSRRVKSERTGSYSVEYETSSVTVETINRYKVPRV